MERTYYFVGGDKRNEELANILKNKGYIVKVYEDNMNLKEFLYQAKYVISGIPFSRDNKIVNSSDLLTSVDIEELFKSMRRNTVLIAGNFSDNVRDLANKYKIKLYDFLEDEDFAVYNAIPTAEGAIEIAINKTKTTINSSNCLVLGFGRIGKVLSELLKGLHANVTVVARKAEDIAWIKAMGYESKGYDELNEILDKFDIIFNTVPALIIGNDEIEHIRKDCLIIDLASKPGGVDFKLAKEKGIDTSFALGLPGKVSPKSVAEYMLNKVMNVN